MPKILHPKETQKYSEEFKSKAVQLSLFPDVKVKDVAKTLDIHPFMLSRWRKEFREGKLVTDKRKKVATVSRGGMTEKFRFIHRYKKSRCSISV